MPIRRVSAGLVSDDMRIVRYPINPLGRSIVAGSMQTEILEYIRHQEREDPRLEQMNLSR